MNIIAPDTLQFLHDVKENNNREWFALNKHRYVAARENLFVWLTDLIAKMKTTDGRVIANGPRGIGRIYRDIRFSPDKTPYRTFLGAMIFRAPEGRNCEFYIHFEPGNIFAGGGIYQPDSSQLRLIRDDLAYSTQAIDKIVDKPAFKKYFGAVSGEKLQRAPKGFQPDHPSIEWLKYKQFLVLRSFSDKQALQPGFMNEIYATFAEASPLFDYLDNALNFRD